MTPRERLKEQEDLLLELLFQDERRAEFFADRAGFLKQTKASDETSTFFMALSEYGLVVDAEYRQHYVMSTLCRAYPLVSASIGCTERGRWALRTFLSSEAIFSTTRERTRAFGEHLFQILDFNIAELPPETHRLLVPYFHLEQTRVENAALLRAYVEENQSLRDVVLTLEHSPKDLQNGKLIRPPFFQHIELPFPVAVIQNALDGCRAENAWHKIQHGHLQPERLSSVARALSMPVTVAMRGIVKNISRSAVPEVAPLIDVNHLTLELNGRVGETFSGFDGSRVLVDYPPALQSLASVLVDGGLLLLQ